MRMAKRAILRLALVGWVGLSGLSGLGANLAQAAAPPEQVLPDSTVLLLKVNDVKLAPRGIPPESVRPALE